LILFSFNFVSFLCFAELVDRDASVVTAVLYGCFLNEEDGPCLALSDGDSIINFLDSLPVFSPRNCRGGTSSHAASQPDSFIPPLGTFPLERFHSGFPATVRTGYCFDLPFCFPGL